MSHRVLLLACSATKLSVPAPAYQIYQGAIFRKGLDWAQREGLWVMILSAKYGLINWDYPVSPYDQLMDGNYRGPWPKDAAGNDLSGYYLGGARYFKHAPSRLKPLVPSGTMGFMMRDLNKLLNGATRDSLFP
jgi:hypothetical protein